MKKVIWTVFMLVCITGVAFAAQNGVKKKRPKPFEYGMVVIDNYTHKSGIAPAIFDHWVHRDKFTCRLCHVDIGFAMKAGATQIKAADNMRGYFCGTCHNGTMVYGTRKVFAACSKDVAKADYSRCRKCHVETNDTKKEDDFDKFAERLPKGRFGNGIDWEKAEEQGLIKPVDTLEGVSIKRAAMANQKDFSLTAKTAGMPEIIFSHKKHTVWNGCELCHPDLFLGVKKGSTKYSMVEIFDNKYCGACHTSVAFPLADCQRCHIKPPQ
jgi:c(7)-type cytochrome triheme protein